MGNRIAKNVFDDNWNLEKSTYYIMDAQGNHLSFYEHEVDNNSVLYNLKERHIYGSSALEINMESVNLYGSSSISSNVITELGHKSYSMSNHLGNVLTVILKIPISSNNLTTTGYWDGIRNISDYSPFGILLKERTFEWLNFRTGFQGQEGDDEVKGDGNSLNLVS